MKIQMMKLCDLNPAAYNPRKALKPGDPEFEKLKHSIESFGYVELIVVNESNNNTVISGHQRLSVMKHLGMEEAECIVVALSPEQEKALNVAMNKVSGDWDKDKLALVIADLQGADFDVSLTGFDQAEIDDLFREQMNDAVHEDGFDVDAELQKPCISRSGDIWKLGRHTVVCGDSTLPETYAALLGGTKVNLVCTDPPYMIKLESTSGKIKNDDLNDVDAYDFLSKAFSCFRDAMAKDASIYVFYATAKARVFHDAYEDAGFKVGAGLVWKKDRLVLTRTDWKYIHEPIIWGWRKDGKHIWYGDQKQKTVFEFDRIKNSKEDGCGHPSSKPVPLIAYLIEQCTQSNGLVLDGFLGSASTLVACQQLNRICFGIEMEPKFVDVAVKRYIELMGSDENVTLTRDGRQMSFAEAEAEISSEEE